MQIGLTDQTIKEGIMDKFKANLIKIFSMAFAFCIAFAIATVPVSAEETAKFSVVQGASIRINQQDGYTGLKFETQVNNAWLAENAADSYTFGTLIFPTANKGEFNGNWTPTFNMTRTDGVNIIAKQNVAVASGFTYSASIVFDDAQIKQAIVDMSETDSIETVNDITPEQFNRVKRGLYAKDFTAMSYVTFGGNTIYTEITAYSTSMLKVAARTMEKVDSGEITENIDVLRESAMYYVGEVSYEKAYVSADDKILVVDSLDDVYTTSNNTVIAVGNDTMKKDVDYTVDGQGRVVFNDVSSKIGSTQKVYLFENDPVKVVETLFVHKALETDEDVALAFDSSAWLEGDDRIADKVNDHYFCLVNDIDMSEIAITNPNTVTFGGYLDGRGYSIKNLTTKVASYDEVGGSWIKNGGFLGYDTNENAVVKNVAFINLNTSNYDALQGGALANDANGVYENIYFDLNVNIAKQGLFSKIGNATFTNVVINAPTAEGYSNANYGKYVADEDYGISPFIRNITSADSSKLNNVYLISKKAVAFKKTYYPGDGNPSYIVYGENESEILYSYSEFAGIENPTVQNTLETGKTVVVENIRRYDNMDKLALDTDATHLANLKEMVATGMWKVEGGNLIWHQTIVPVTLKGVDYDASSGELKTTALNGEIIATVIVNGQEFTKENGGLITNAFDEIVGIRAKASASDTGVGITFVDVNSNQNLSFSEFAITTESGKVFYIENLIYWNIVAKDQDDVLEAFDIAYWEEGDSRLADKVNDYYITLANDIDMTDTTVKNATESTYKGIFDGRGHSLENVTVDVGATNYGVGGFFGGTISSNAVVKNVAFINLSSVSSNVPMQVVYGGLFGAYEANGTFENLYIDMNVNISKQGLFRQPGSAKFTNVVINAPTTEGFSNADYVNYVPDEEQGVGLFIRNVTGADSSKLNNVYIISKKAVAFKKEYFGTDNYTAYFVYGENETELFYNYSAFEGIENPTVQNTLETGRTVVVENIRRYDDMDKLALDTDATHLANLEEMVATGMWKVEDGNLIWKGAQA